MVVVVVVFLHTFSLKLLHHPRLYFFFPFGSRG